MIPDSYAEALPFLTQQTEKIRAYADDFVPEAAWRAIRRRWGHGADLFVYGHSFLLLKPETLARRMAWTALSFVAERGFEPVAHARLVLDRHASNQVWRFQWNAATADRVELTHLVNARSESLLVVLRDRQPGPVPASVKLWQLKGSAHAERRTADHLRSALHMHNRMLGFVHTPDEPADLVRELAILFDPRALDRLLAAARSADCNAGLMNQCRQWAADAQSRCEAHSVNPQEVLQRLGPGAGNQVLAAVIGAMGHGRRLALDDVLGRFEHQPGGREGWDALTIAAELIQHDKDGARAVLDARAASEVFERWDDDGERVQAGLGSECNA